MVDIGKQKAYLWVHCAGALCRMTSLIWRAFSTIAVPQFRPENTGAVPVPGNPIFPISVARVAREN
jgi:hypothetical protein